MMNNNFRYVITLQAASDILIAQGEILGTYSLENIQLEYETIDNLDVARKISQTYNVGRSQSYDHVTLMKTLNWAASSTLINENINLPRKSMKAIVLLFSKSTVVDSEEFMYPNISEVKVTIEGVPNVVYSQGVKRSRFYEEANRLFNQDTKDQFMTLEKFFKDKFALLIDLRAHVDKSVMANGREIINTQNGILLEIKKTAHTGILKCSLFVVSDALVKFVNNDLQSIGY